jgi:hypothetical protein
MKTTDPIESVDIHISAFTRRMKLYQKLKKSFEQNH